MGNFPNWGPCLGSQYSTGTLIKQDPPRDPNLENYPCDTGMGALCFPRWQFSASASPTLRSKIFQPDHKHTGLKPNILKAPSPQTPEARKSKTPEPLPDQPRPGPYLPASISSSWPSWSWRHGLPNSRIHTCMHTYMHTYIHTYIHTYRHTDIQTYTKSITMKLNSY